jgi:hypothetical protein
VAGLSAFTYESAIGVKVTLLTVVGEGVSVGVEVGVLVGRLGLVGVGDIVAVAVAVRVGVSVGKLVSVGVGDDVAVGVSVGRLGLVGV